MRPPRRSVFEDANTAEPSPQSNDRNFPFGISRRELNIAPTIRCQRVLEKLQLACASAQAGSRQKKRTGRYPSFSGREYSITNYYVNIATV